MRRVLLIIAIIALGIAGVALFAQSPTPPTPEVQRLQHDLLGEQQANLAMKDRLAALAQELDHFQQTATTACIQAVEVGNPGKTINPEHHFAIEDKVEPKKQ